MIVEGMPLVLNDHKAIIAIVILDTMGMDTIVKAILLSCFVFFYSILSSFAIFFFFFFFPFARPKTYEI